MLIGKERTGLRVNTALGEGVRRVVRSYSKQLDRPRLGMFRYSHIFKRFTHSIFLIFRISYSEIFETTYVMYFKAVSLFTFILVDILYAQILCENILFPKYDFSFQVVHATKFRFLIHFIFRSFSPILFQYKHMLDRYLNIHPQLYSELPWM
jgi:hypothetical protein